MSVEPKPGSSGTPDEDLRARLEKAKAGGDPRYHAKLREQGKLFVRERLDRILDPGWSFEDGLLARHVDGNLPADAVVTVVGTIDGRPVCVIANDMTVKAGTWGLRTFQKITAMQELAGRTKCPLLYLIDSAGARIDEQRASYPASCRRSACCSAHRPPAPPISPPCATSASWSRATRPRTSARRACRRWPLARR